MNAISPLRGPKSIGGGFAAAHFRARRASYGAAPPASRVLRIALRATALRAALDPGDHCGPWARKSGQAQACPRAARGAQTPGGGGPQQQAERQDTGELAFDSQKWLGMETAWRQHGDRMEAAYIRSGQGAVWYMRGRVAARLPAKPARGLAIGRGGLIVLKLNKKLLGAAGALVTAVSLTVTGLTAASASSTGSSGTEFLQAMSTSATSATQPVIVHGVFTDYGVDHSGDTVDTFVLQKGSFKVAHSPGTGPQHFDPKTCLNRINQHGTYRIFHGTGKYAGIHGHGTYHVRLLFIAARVAGKCSDTKPPVAFQLIITASGPVRLP